MDDFLLSRIDRRRHDLHPHLYDVESHRYSSYRIAFRSTSDEGTAEAIVARYPRGARVPVYYDPDDPAQSVLEPGVDKSVLVGLAVGVLCASAGMFFVLRGSWLDRVSRENRNLLFEAIGIRGASRRDTRRKSTEQDDPPPR